MTTIPPRVQERRDELLRHRKAHIDVIGLHEQGLRASRSELAAIDGELAGIDLTVSAYTEERAAPAEERVPRAPRRDIRGMVLEAVKNAPHGASAAALGTTLQVRASHVKQALEYWRDKGEITLRGDVARAGGDLAAAAE